MVTIDWSALIALGTLGFSGYTFWRTQRLAEKQAELIDDQKRLNKLLLDREEEAAVSAKRADVSARVVRMGGRTVVKVFNRGNAVAQNVRVIVPGDNTLFVRSDVASKFPLERLEPQQGVDVIASSFLGAESKQYVTLIWDDDFAKDSEKTVPLTL